MSNVSLRLPGPLLLGALAGGAGVRVELPPHGVLGARGLAQLLEGGHVDVVFTQQRVRVLQVKKPLKKKRNFLASLGFASLPN